MKTVNTMVKLSIATALTFAVVGCGGGGSSSDSDTKASSSSTAQESSSSSSSVASAPSKLTGKFVDSPVEGLSYQCIPSNISGKTDVSGTVECDGTDTRFSIGVADTYLGYVPLTDNNFVATPFSLTMDAVTSAEAQDYGFTDFLGNNFKASHYKGWDYAPVIAQLLQILDVDGNPDNGITIDTEKEETLLYNGTLRTDINEIGTKLKALFPTSYVSNDVATANMISYLDENYGALELVPEQENALQEGSYYKLGNYSDKIVHNDKGLFCKAYNKYGDYLENAYGYSDDKSAAIMNIMNDGNIEKTNAWTIDEGKKYEDIDFGITTETVKYQDMKGSYFRKKEGADDIGFTKGWEVLPNSVLYYTIKPTDNNELISTSRGDIFVKNETPTSELGDSDYATMNCTIQTSTRYVLIPSNEVPEAFADLEKRIYDNVYQ